MGKRVFIDEFSMVPNKFMEIIYKAWLKHDIKVFMFGDVNQCDQVVDNNSISHNYLVSYGINKCVRTL